MLLCCTVGYHFSFYYSTAELYQGLALMCLLGGMLDRYLATKGSKRVLLGVLALLLTAWTSLYHQILVIPLAFLIGYTVLQENKSGRTKQAFVLYALLIAWFVFRIMVFEKSTYEANRMVKFQDFIDHTPRFFELPGWGYFRWEINEMPALLLAMGIAGLLLLMRRAWLRAGLLVAACMGFLYLVVITDHDGQSPVMYENYYTVFGFFAAVVLADSAYALKRLQMKNSLAIALLALLVVGSAQIYRGHEPFTRAVEHYERSARVMSDRGIGKGVVNTNNQPWSFSWMVWPVPFSTALISTCLHEGETRTIYVCDDSREMATNNSGDLVFLGPNWEPLWFTTQNLNERFLLPPSKYVDLTTRGSEDKLGAICKDVELNILPNEMKAKKGSYTYVPVSIRNNSADTLHSVLPSGQSLKIAYQMDSEPASTLPRAHFNSLDMDIYPGEERVFDIAIEKPATDGQYKVTVQLFIAESETYLGPKDSFVLHY